MAHFAGSSALADAGCIVPEIYNQKQNDIDFSRHGRFDMLRREMLCSTELLLHDREALAAP